MPQLGSTQRDDVAQGGLLAPLMAIKLAHLQHLVQRARDFPYIQT